VPTPDFNPHSAVTFIQQSSRLFNSSCQILKDHVDILIGWNTAPDLFNTMLSKVKSIAMAANPGAIDNFRLLVEK
jgi:hypothetical protein